MAPRAAIALVIAAASASVAGATPAPRTMTEFHGDATNMAAASGDLAWTDTVDRIHVLNLRTGNVVTQLFSKQYETYTHDTQLVFAGSRPLWVGTIGGNFKLIRQSVFTTNNGRRVLVGYAVHGEAASGGFVTAVAGSPAGGAFGIAELKDLEPPSEGCFCKFVLVGGGVWAVANGSSHRVVGLPPPSLLARFGDEVALAPVNPNVEKRPLLAPAPDAPVEVRSLRDASTISTFDSPRPLNALALTSQFVFTLAGYGKTTRLEVHDPATGTLLRSLHRTSLEWRDVPGGPYPPIFTAGGRWAVYAKPHEVWAVDGSSGRTVLIARTKSVVQDISTDGRTVTWAEVDQVSRSYSLPERLRWLTRFRTAPLP
jgi:hypothetical protein